MDRDTIVRLARDAGLLDILEEHHNEYGGGDFDVAQYEELERFAALVAAQVEATWQNRYLRLNDLMQARESQPNKPCCLAEREACAKVCEARVMGDHNREDEEAKRCAEDIRRRA